MDLESLEENPEITDAMIDKVDMTPEVPDMLVETPDIFIETPSNNLCQGNRCNDHG